MKRQGEYFAQEKYSSNGDAAKKFFDNTKTSHDLLNQSFHDFLSREESEQAELATKKENNTLKIEFPPPNLSDPSPHMTFKPFVPTNVNSADNTISVKVEAASDEKIIRHRGGRRTAAAAKNEAQKKASKIASLPSAKEHKPKTQGKKRNVNLLSNIDEQESSDEDLVNPDELTEIDEYLRQNYIKVELGSTIFKNSESKIKSYALKLAKNQIQEMFKFIKPRWSIFMKIWIMINKDDDEILFLVKQSYLAQPYFFIQHLGNNVFEFYVLKNNRKTPKNRKGFLPNFRDTKIHCMTYRQRPKAEFVRKIRRFQEWMNKHGFEEVIKPNISVLLAIDPSVLNSSTGRNPNVPQESDDDDEDSGSEEYTDTNDKSHK